MANIDKKVGNVQHRKPKLDATHTPKPQRFQTTLQTTLGNKSQTENQLYNEYTQMEEKTNLIVTQA